MDWKELIEALGSALTEVEEDQRRQQQQREQAEAAGAAAAENDKNNEPEEEEEEEGGEDLKAASVANAIQTMNHKLIEIHSRLKSFDEEASDIPPSSSGSQVRCTHQIYVHYMANFRLTKCRWSFFVAIIFCVLFDLFRKHP